MMNIVDKMERIWGYKNNDDSIVPGKFLFRDLQYYESQINLRNFKACIWSLFQFNGVLGLGLG